jgi:hypothetical protein
MRGKSMRGDGVFDMRRFCISPDYPQLVSKNETRGGVLYRPHGLDRKALMRSAWCNRISSAVIVSRDDLEGLGYDVTSVDDATMLRLADKMADAYVESAFWIDLPILADYLKIPKKK